MTTQKKWPGMGITRWGVNDIPPECRPAIIFSEFQSYSSHNSNSTQLNSIVNKKIKKFGHQKIT